MSIHIMEFIELLEQSFFDISLNVETLNTILVYFERFSNSIITFSKVVYLNSMQTDTAKEKKFNYRIKYNRN